MISAVVTSWNGREHLPACLDALRAQSPAPDEIVVADNHSDDGSRELVAARYPDVRVIDTGANEGPGRARNHGARAARGDLLLFVDNDVVLEPGALAALLAELDAHPDCGLVQARSVCADDRELVHYDAADLHYLGLLSMPSFFAPIADAPAEPRAVGACVSLCFLARRAAFEAAAGFREELFFYFEDTEFSWRVRALGWTIRWTPAAVCLHGGGTAGLSTRGAGLPARRAYYHARNRWLMLWTCMRWRTYLLTFPAQLGYALLQFAFALAKGRGWQSFRGSCAALAMLPAALRWRRPLQRARTAADRDLLIAAPLSMHPGIAARGPGAWLRRALDALFVGWWRGVRWLCG